MHQCLACRMIWAEQAYGTRPTTSPILIAPTSLTLAAPQAYSVAVAWKPVSLQKDIINSGI